jgi:uncharacterized membrane protein
VPRTRAAKQPDRRISAAHTNYFEGIFMSIGHSLEHAEHVAHSAHGGHGTPGKSDKLGTYIGVTMAILGVLLAVCSALVGSERTVLVQKLVEQQNAHAKYQAQDVKHRVAFLALSQVHAVAFATAVPVVKKEAILSMASSVQRYLAESVAAKDWTVSYDSVIKVHMEAQEEFEHGLLLAEIGIVIASIALLMKRREVWIVSLVLGVGCVFILSRTLLHVSHEVKESERAIATTKAKYEELRSKNKTTEEEEKLVRSLVEWASAPAR